VPRDAVAGQDGHSPFSWGARQDFPLSCKKFRRPGTRKSGLRDSKDISC
jgi:hypothetical protein